MEAFSASVTGKQVSWTEMPVQEWKSLFRIARQQQVLPLIYQAVYDCPTIKHCSEAFEKIGDEAKRQVYEQAQKTNAFLELNRKLCAAGVKPLIVKGLVCRTLYPYPDQRPSTDEDILISEDRFEIAHQVMVDNGMQMMDPEQDITKDDEISYIRKGTKEYIEIHKHLFPRNCEVYGDLNDYFKNVHERAVQETILGETVYTLGYTDHLFYLICHAFKHFIGPGCGVRMICDIVFYANAYGSKIDWAQVINNCREIHAYKFVAALFQIGTEYFGFDYEKARCPKAWYTMEVDTTMLLKDMLGGGVLGISEKGRMQSGAITSNAVVASKKGEETKVSLWKSIFPSWKHMSERPEYKYVNKYPYLLPIAWISRFVEYGISIIKGKKAKPTKSIQIGLERVALLREYDIID